MIGIVQTNVVAVKTEEFLMIEEALASNIVLRIIYITVPKLLATLSIMV